MAVTAVDATGANFFVMERIRIASDIFDGVIATGRDVHITNCFMQCSGDGVKFEGDRTTITDCTINADTPIVITSAAGTCDQWKITNNRLSGSIGGMTVADGLNGTIAFNTMSAQQHGISLVDSSRCLILGNHVIQPGAGLNNTYDGIILSGNSDFNDIRNNKIQGRAVTNKPRYAINISVATCDSNSYLGNRSGPASDYGAANPYNDAGVGTVNTWPGAAAPQGDNLL